METRAVVIEAYGGKDQLKEATVQLPELKANQLLVKVAATSINPIDWKLREGYLKQMFPWDFPIILGWDVAGDIVEIGADVTEFKVGDAIYARPETTRFGTYADYAIVDAELAAIKPENQNYAEAAAVPLAGLTAYQALFEHGRLKEGEKVLIQKLGADEIIDYHTTDFEEVLQDIDLVFDTMGGDTQKKSFTVLKPKGRLISILSIEDEDLAKEKDIFAKAIWLRTNGKQLAELTELIVIENQDNFISQDAE